MTLGELIREYREQHSLSMEEFARLSGLSKGYISMLEKNKNPRNGKPIIPSIATYDGVATAMHVSAAELMEKVGEKSDDLPDLNAREVFARNLSNLLQSTDRTQAELAAYVNVAPPTITDWKKGRKMPRMDRIEKIAKFFHVSTDLLLGNTDAQKNDDLPDLNARDERQIERDLEDMMHSVSTAAYEGDTDAQEDVEAFKATLRAAMIQAKRIAKKKYTPRKYQQ